MMIPDDLIYTESHEWIKREGDKIRVGITDHAQSELTDVVYVELPKLERQVNAKDPIAVVESVKAASDIYAPVKGTVVEANKALEADPGLINREPYGQGWIFVLKIENPDDLNNLKDAGAYKSQIGLNQNFFERRRISRPGWKKITRRRLNSGLGFTKRIRESRASRGPSLWIKPSASAGSTEFGNALTKSATKFASRRGGAAAFGARSISNELKSSLGKNRCDRLG